MTDETPEKERESRRLPGLLVILALVSVLAVVATIWRLQRRKMVSPEPVEAPSLPPGVLLTGPQLLEKQKAQKALLTEPWGRDPFSEASLEEIERARMKEAQLKEEGPREFILTGILIRGERKIAVINHTVVREGELLQGAQLTRIDRDQVILKKDQEEIILRLNL